MPPAADTGPVSREPTQADLNPIEPLVSIVVCFHNCVEVTELCVDSVERHTSGHAHEVILVDDGSTDERALGVATGRRNVILVRSEVNAGFTKSANLGASRASGRYLVFLNNDTEVTPGWLDALLDAACSGPEVAVVGSRLVYPDGRLQEAGGCIWEDGTGLNYGKWHDPLLSQFNYRREVDYCSGAALLVDRGFFESIRGFDERFSPGYYEDTDLCFAARASGRVVLYEPESRVVHLEGASFGTETQSGASTVFTKSSQEINRFRFRAKWSDQLLKHYPPGTAHGLLGGRMDRRPRVLVAETQVPAADRDAGGHRLYWMVRLLHHLGCAVTFVPADRHDRKPYSDELRRAGIEVHCDNVPLEDFGRERSGLYDLVILSKPDPWMQLYGTCRRFFPRATLVYDTVDLQFVREERRLATLDRDPDTDRLEHEQRRLRRRELDYIKSADLTSVVTDVEAEVVRSWVPDARLVILPTVHEPAAAPLPGFDEREGVLFIGSYTHPPNVDAVRWYVEEIDPLLPAEGDYRLTALGSDPPDELLGKASDRLHIPGFLPDVANYFRRARVFVAPLRYGAGMKGKIGHAMAFGVPVVATKVGAEGMGLVDGQHVLIADDALSFAAAVERLYSDPVLWQTLSTNAFERVRTHWTPAAMADRLRDLLTLCGLEGRLIPRKWGLREPL